MQQWRWMDAMAQDNDDDEPWWTWLTLYLPWLQDCRIQHCSNGTGCLPFGVRDKRDWKVRRAEGRKEGKVNDNTETNKWNFRKDVHREDGMGRHMPGRFCDHSEERLSFPTNSRQSVCNFNVQSQTLADVSLTLGMTDWRPPPPHQNYLFIVPSHACLPACLLTCQPSHIYDPEVKRLFI